MSSSVANSSPFYSSMSLLESLNLVNCSHATHCMLYSRPDTCGISYALLQMRFDGLLGFVGGGVDVQDVNVHHIVDAMNRELDEEINYTFESVTQSEWICSHHDFQYSFVQHFFAKELSFEQLLQIGRTHITAHHFPIESLGLIFVPINDCVPKSSCISRPFIDNLLLQKFAGNGKQQFIESLRKRKLLSDERIIQLEDISKSVSTDVRSDLIKGTEVKAMLTINTGVHYYDETVDVTYGLMVMRDNGLFDFLGTDFVDKKDNNSMIQILNESLKRDLGSYSQPFVSENHSIDLSFDNDGSHVFYSKLNSNQFIEIETNFVETENFLKNSYGLFRIPFRFRGTTKKANHFLNRFFNGFLNQYFVNNSKSHLKYFSDKLFKE